MLMLTGLPADLVVVGKIMVVCSTLPCPVYSLSHAVMRFACLPLWGSSAWEADVPPDTQGLV